MSDVGALIDQAIELRAQNRLAEAQAALRRALAEAPQSVEAHAALFDVLYAQGEIAPALAELEAVLQLRPDWADARFNYGCLLRRHMRLAEAEEAFRQTIATAPAHAGAYRMLGGVLLGHCRVDEALELYRAGRAHCPDDFLIESAEVFALTASDRVSADEHFARQAAFGRRLESAHPAPARQFRGTRDPGRRLRIGYLSGDLAHHVVTLFLLPVLERHDRAAFQVHAYSTTEAPDGYTARIAGSVDVWRECAALGEAELAEAIAADGIDILVDLAGHSGVPNLGALAQRAAPIQATWLGYLGSTGLTRMDYRITDAHADPEGMTDRLHTETLVRLPHSQWCYRPLVSRPAAAVPPSVRNSFVTFGSFNQAMKLSVSTRRLWARILSQLPAARLLVLGVPAGAAQQRLRDDLAQAGADPARIALAPFAPIEEYLRRFDEVDIALDSTPYSGGTTTCDALWMGVPVLTAPGPRPASRSAASILTTLGLTDWIASDAEDYVRRAVALSSQQEKLKQLRATLRSRMQASALMDEAGFTRDLENAYRRMWRQYCGRQGA
jgi:protein O-GlcNAc transferase